MLSVERVTRTFNNGKTAVKNVSFTAKQGEIIGILGTSGCGKSTLLRVIAGLDSGYEGTVKFNEQAVNGVREETGIIFQEPRLMPWLTVIENVSFGLKGSKNDKIVQAKRFIELVNLDGFEQQYPKELSGGMAQRVAIARALVTSPEVLLLDEPFSALDAFTKMQLQDLLLEVWKACQSTMLLVTHDIDEALYLCDRLLILRGQPGELFQEIKVGQERPRSRGDHRLAEQKEAILNMLDLTHVPVERMRKSKNVT